MPRTSGKREQNRQANLAAILKAGHDCFLESGYEAVTIRDVIRRTGLASGTFYNYFPDKESVFRALVEDRIRGLTRRLTEVRRAARRVEDFLRNAYTTVFGEICSDPAFYAMMFRNEAAVRSLYQDHNPFDYSERALKADLRDAIARRVVPEIDVDYMAAILFGTAYELARTMALGRRRDPQGAAEFVTRLFLGGVAALAPETALVRRGSLKLGGAAR
jgi:AcrR family transcriptional regulator